MTEPTYVHWDSMLMVKESTLSRGDCETLVKGNTVALAFMNVITNLGSKNWGAQNWIKCKAPEYWGGLETIKETQNMMNLCGNIPDTTQQGPRTGLTIKVKDITGYVTLEACYADILKTMEKDSGGQLAAGWTGCTTIGWRSATMSGMDGGTSWTGSAPWASNPRLPTSYRMVAVKCNSLIQQATNITWDDVFENKNGVAGFYSQKQSDPEQKFEILYDAIHELTPANPRKTVRYEFRNMNLVSDVMGNLYDPTQMNKQVVFLFAVNVGAADWNSTADIIRSMPIFVSNRCIFENYTRP